MRWRRLWRYDSPSALLALSIALLAWEITAVFFLGSLALLLRGLSPVLHVAGLVFLVLPVLYTSLALLDFIGRRDEPSEPPKAVPDRQRITNNSMIAPRASYLPSRLKWPRSVQGGFQLAARQGSTCRLELRYGSIVGFRGQMSVPHSHRERAVAQQLRDL